MNRQSSRRCPKCKSTRKVTQFRPFYDVCDHCVHESEAQKFCALTRKLVYLPMGKMAR